MTQWQPCEKQHAGSEIRIAIDIGSTVVKLARVASDGDLLSQEFCPRDFDAGIARQVESIVNQTGFSDEDVLICSSANGGLRVGIICLTEHFSGATLRNQVLMAGANPVFVCGLDDQTGNLDQVDILIVGGGIDCVEAAPLEQRLRRFDARKYRFSALAYAGNRHHADLFLHLFPQATVITNPLSERLLSKSTSVSEAIRRAYLDDLVHKRGISDLRKSLSKTIRPTPEVVNRGFQRIMFNRSRIEALGPCMLLDIGGATTDLHYTTDIIREDSEEKALPGSSVARYVFTDLGIVASRDSTLLQLRGHPRLYDLLGRIAKDGDIRGMYQSLREGEFEPSPRLLSYTCLFIALDRFANGSTPGLPSADLSKVAQIMLTGGAAQILDVSVASRVVDLFVCGHGNPCILIDRCYQIWVDGITWSAIR
jgi:hypothetical protein